MSVNSLASGPCDCVCHNQKGVMHTVPCCAYTYIPREEAETKVAKITVEAYVDPEWDGVWVRCPHCEHENGITWAGDKVCTQCEEVFIVARGILVQDKGMVGSE